MIFKAQTEWVKPTEFPDLRHCDEIVIDLETYDPDLKKLGTGSVVGRSFTQDGDQNPGKIPIQEIQNGSGSNKMQQLIGTYNYYLQMIRDVTGLNEATDASTPAERSLVGVQKLAAANSNTATRHIMQSR